MEEAGPEAVPEDLLVVGHVQLLEGVIVLADLLLEADQGLVQLLPLLVEFGKVVDLRLVVLGHLDV